ncbi:MAG: hypothetical protein AAF645_02900 [Myxococcota bacterium]
MLLAFGCGNDETMVEPDVGPPPVEPALVDAPETFAGETLCVPLEAGEMPLASSPDGDLWLSGPAGLRVVDASGVNRAVALGPEGELRALSAWSDVDAIALTDQGFWRIDAEGALFLFAPQRVRDGVAFCGDPQVDGEVAVLAPDALFERDAGEWFETSSDEVGAFDGADWLGSFAGACHGRRGGTWLRRGDQLHRVRGTSIATFDAPPSTLPPVLDESLIAIAQESKVLVASERGPASNEWSEVVFAAGNVDELAAGGGALWVRVGGEIFRFLDEEWRQADDRFASANGMFAHLGGLWVANGSELCHVGSSTVRLRGLRPYEVFLDPTRDLRVDAIGGEVADLEGLELRVDGIVVDGELDERGRIFNDVMLGSPGWHRLTLGRGEALERDLSYRVVAGDLSFSRDIATIADAHCATALCHGDGADAESIPLTSFEQWRDSALEIRDRVSRGTMPREASDGWGVGLATVIIDWVQGGRQP